MAAPEVLRIATGIVFFTAGLAWLIKASVALQRARRSVGWSVVPGTVSTSEVYRSPWYAGVQRTYRARVRYEYEVSGARYAGDQVRFGGDLATSWAHGVEADLASYPVGKAVTVHYDPGAPKRSVLEPGSHGVTYAQLAVAGVFVVISAAFLLSAVGAIDVR